MYEGVTFGAEFLQLSLFNQKSASIFFYSHLVLES